MSYHICPACEEESIRTDCHDDSDGDEIFTRHFRVAEIVEKTCSCELTDEQIEAIEKENTCEPSDDY